MKPLARELLALARTQRGVVSAADLERFNVVGRARSTLLHTGQLVALHKGVYRFAVTGDSFEQRCVAACVAAPHAVLSGPTAGRWWGLRRVFTEDVHLISRRGIRLDGVAVHRTDLLAPSDVATRFGLPVLAPLRLLCDLAWHLDDAGLESVFEQLLDRELLTVPSARGAAVRFAARGRPGTVRLFRVLDSRPDWLAPADSDLEVRLWRALADRGVLLERQVPVRLDSGVLIHLDLADPGLRFGIEVDHVTWHGGRLDAQRDKRRDRDVARVGWTVLRVPDDDIRQRLAATAEDLIVTMIRRRPA